MTFFKVLPSVSLQSAFLKQTLHPTWGSDSQPRDQKSHPLSAGPARHLRVCLLDVSTLHEVLEPAMG